MSIQELTIFEKIIKKIIPAIILYETDKIIVIKDINPQAPIHLLIIPKEKFITISDIPIEKIEIINHIVLTAQHLARTIPEADEYKLIINNGKRAGQCIFYLHVHFLSGYKK